jgi:hypothetical protein
MKDLYEQQNRKCFICEEDIDPSLHNVEIDHVVPLNLGGKDEPNNFALVHQICNREKQDSNLIVARCIKRFDKIRSEVYRETGKSPDLSHILNKFGGSRFELSVKLIDGKIRYTLEDVEKEPTIYEAPIFTDELSNFQSFFTYLPIEYIFHDERGINPRTLSERVKELIKEFYMKRPQLHVGLARINIDNNSSKARVFIFDGQHKAAAQILLGARKLPLRIFVNPDLELLTQTNERAGTILRQVAFDLSVRRQLGSTILAWKIEGLQRDKGLRSDDYSFSEKDLVTHYHGEGREIKKFILDRVRNEIMNSKENKLRDYITLGGKEKDKPISYSAIDKTFFSLLLSQDILDVRPFFNKKRENEISNMVRLMNLVADIVLEGYDFSIGSWRIEEEVRAEREGRPTRTGAARHIPDQHLRAVRMIKEEIMYNWVRYIRQIVSNYFIMRGLPIDEDKLWQEEFDDTLWKHIENFLKNLRNLPLWVDREKTHIFSAKLPYDWWSEVFRSGVTKDGIKLLSEGINLMNMIKD